MHFSVWAFLIPEKKFQTNYEIFALSTKLIKASNVLMTLKIIVSLVSFKSTFIIIVKSISPLYQQLEFQKEKENLSKLLF